MPESTSLSALRTRQPFLRSVSQKLAADGSATTAVTVLPPASLSRSAAYSSSVFCLLSRRAS